MVKKKQNSLEENIKNYSKEIKTIEDFPKAVRKMPGMYIGRIGNDGFLTMIKEVYQNSIDELMKESSSCTEVCVIYKEDIKEVTVIDNGRGIPFDKMADIFFKQHTSSNYNKTIGEYSSGRHGVGAKVTNALSEYFIIESYINIPGMCEARRAEFVEGYINDKGVYKIPNKDKLQGTKITFKPTAMMGNITTTVEDVYNLVKSILFLTKLNSRVTFKGIKNGQVFREELVNTKGIGSILELYLETPIMEPIKIFADTGEMKADIQFTFDIGKSEPVIVGYSNFCPTASGTHINGFVDGVIKYFKDYMNKIYLKDSNSKRKNKLTLTAQDVRNTLVGVVAAAHLNPIFTGQAKDELSNEDMYPFVKDLVIDNLKQWGKTNNSELMKVCKHLKDLAEIRARGENEKIKLADNYKSSSLSKGLPEKYTAPNGEEGLELVICEGDSASGTFKNARDHLRQGIFPIRGKIKNALACSKKDSLTNAEVSGILAIVGAGAGTNKFKPEEVKWDKIIFAADADVDGCHIACLLLNLFLVHCPQLIEMGKIYKAVPPLYGIETKPGKIKYLTNDKAYIDYVQKLFIKENTVHDPMNNKLSNSRLAEILENNIDYVYEVDNLAKAYSISPELLELICILFIENGKDLTSKKAVKTIRTRLQDKFRFVDAEVINDTLMVKGLINNRTNTIYLNDSFMLKCAPVLLALSQDLYYFLVDDQLLSRYELMSRFEKFKPKNITRYKGLGEMSGWKLAESTLHPDGERTLIQYTMESAKAEVEAITYLENNRKETIKGVKVSRHDLS